MKLAAAFFRMIRWINLFFILLTQALFYSCLTLPVFNTKGVPPVLTPFLFCLLSFASVLIAAAGYIINDYFDLNIDRVNKPEKLVVDKIIRRRWAILWHFLFSLAGVGLSLYVAFCIPDWHSFLVAFINIICVAALWMYSTIYKRRLLIGNILISLLTAWSVFVIYLVNLKSWYLVKYLFKNDYNQACTRLFKFAVLYAAFAYIISMVREVIKDIEDMEGDAKYGCRTMPIAWGVRSTKVFIVVWLIVLLAMLVVIQVYAFQLGWWQIGRAHV